jgi:ferredoxin
MLASSGYVAQVDADLCAACGTCAEYCQFGAISVHDGFARIDTAATFAEADCDIGVLLEGLDETGRSYLERSRRISEVESADDFASWHL